MTNETAPPELSPRAHTKAAEAFVDRIRSLFGSEVIVAGDASRSDGRFLSQLAELRQQADYGYDDLDVDVDTFLSRTRELVSDMEVLCET